MPTPTQGSGEGECGQGTFVLGQIPRGGWQTRPETMELRSYTAAEREMASTLLI